MKKYLLLFCGLPITLLSMQNPENQPVKRIHTTYTATSYSHAMKMTGNKRKRPFSDEEGRKNIVRHYQKEYKPSN